MKIPVYRDEWLDREKGVETSDGAITSITTLSGKRFKGKVFIDATYEGDLMASAGVSIPYRQGGDGCVRGAVERGADRGFAPWPSFQFADQSVCGSWRSVQRLASAHL